MLRWELVATVGILRRQILMTFIARVLIMLIEIPIIHSLCLMELRRVKNFPLHGWVPCGDAGALILKLILRFYKVEFCRPDDRDLLLRLLKILRKIIAAIF